MIRKYISSQKVCSKYYKVINENHEQRMLSVTAKIRGNFVAIFMLIRDGSTFDCFAYNVKSFFRDKAAELRLIRNWLYIGIIKATLKAWLVYVRKDKTNSQKDFVLFRFYFWEICIFFVIIIALLYEKNEKGKLNIAILLYAFLNN